MIFFEAKLFRETWTELQYEHAFLPIYFNFGLGKALLKLLGSVVGSVPAADGQIE